MFLQRALLAASLLCISPLPAKADTYSVSIDEINTALEDALADDNNLAQFVATLVQEELAAAGSPLTPGAVLVEDTIRDVRIPDGCSFTDLQSISFDARLNPQTRISLTADALNKPIVFELDLRSSLHANGRIKQVVGVDLFGCRRIAEDTFNFSSTGDIRISAVLTLNLNIEQISDRAIRIAPELTLTGQLVSSVIDVNVDNSLLDGFIEDVLQDELRDAVSNARLQMELRELETDLRARLQAELNGTERIFELPDINEEQLRQIAEFLQDRIPFPIPREFVEAVAIDTINALILGDRETLDVLVRTSGACAASSILRVELAQPSLFSLDTNGACLLVDPGSAAAGDYFSDAQCTVGAAFAPTTDAAFCEEAFDKQRLGNAAGIGDNAQPWTLSPGTLFDIGVDSIATNQQPFMTRATYKSVAGAVGNCELEMRIYKRDIGATGLRPLLVFHGGGWQKRTFTFVGIESQISHFTEQGFIVFAPFYRLTGTGDGNAECNGVTGEQIVEDARDALDWVLLNGDRFGSVAGASVAVSGQSAGAHLSAWLAVNRPNDISSGLLLYAPVDMQDFITEAEAGRYTNPEGIRVIEQFLGSPLDATDSFADVAASNTLPAQVAIQPDTIPPLFMLHGRADELVPSRQSVRLCNAFSGSPDNGPAENNGGDPATGVVSRAYECGGGSELHVFAEGEHTLDLCIPGVVCPAGGDASQVAIRDALRAGREFLSGN